MAPYVEFVNLTAGEHHNRPLDAKTLHLGNQLILTFQNYHSDLGRYGNPRTERMEPPSLAVATASKYSELLHFITLKLGFSNFKF